MTRFYDEDDTRVQADKLHEQTIKDTKYLHKKGLTMKGLCRLASENGLRPMQLREDVGFRAHQDHRNKTVPVSLPKIGDK